MVYSFLMSLSGLGIGMILASQMSWKVSSPLLFLGIVCEGLVLILAWDI